MSKIIAGYFDSEDDATRAMDTLLKDPQFVDAESEVISNPARGSGNAGDAGITPIMPNTSSGMGGGTVLGPIAVTGGGGRSGLFSDLDEDEAGYFNSALNSGRGVLALIKVEDEHVMYARQVFSQNGARTYVE